MSHDTPVCYCPAYSLFHKGFRQVYLLCPTFDIIIERCQAFATISQCLCFPPSLLLARSLAKGLFPRLCQHSLQDESVSAGPYK
ncbi:hypothetical protein PROFUN_14915 [Planoprotostelium fungivorum]|uniref:Uncharacterized protein n=1 Tax=Planoprotostelium fungivorum TaxID=1890364 RepID=A0A2P6MY39_9EUKA|nr:hypothetical protein PROFUN_14915 [Planoprotostelium fungivorum]